MILPPGWGDDVCRQACSDRLEIWGRSPPRGTHLTLAFRCLRPGTRFKKPYPSPPSLNVKSVLPAAVIGYAIHGVDVGKNTYNPTKSLGPLEPPIARI